MMEQKILKNLKSGEDYSIKNGVFYFIKTDSDFTQLKSKDLIFKFKLFFKKYPRLFKIFYLFGAAFVGTSAKKAIKKLGPDKLILDLGSGTKLVRKDVINVDFCPFFNVNIVADIANLPLKDNCADAIICEWVLEHVKNPQKIVKEIKRILKPEGLIYIAVPFIESFHSSPDDYYRWSKEGLRELMKDFKEVEFGIKSGPTSAMLSVINDWLATVFSFGFKTLYQFLLILFMIITFPIKFLDYLIFKFPTSKNIAFGFYFIGKKK